jgi:hypothetical protein
MSRRALVPDPVALREFKVRLAAETSDIPQDQDVSSHAGHATSLAVKIGNAPRIPLRMIAQCFSVNPPITALPPTRPEPLSSTPARGHLLLLLEAACDRDAPNGQLAKR